MAEFIKATDSKQPVLRTENESPFKGRRTFQNQLIQHWGFTDSFMADWEVGPRSSHFRSDPSPLSWNIDSICFYDYKSLNKSFNLLKSGMFTFTKWDIDFLGSLSLQFSLYVRGKKWSLNGSVSQMERANLQRRCGKRIHSSLVLYIIYKNVFIEIFFLLLPI